MDLYLVEKTDDSITIGFKKADMAMITPLLEKLGNDDNVVIARMVEEHPELIDRKLFVQTKSGNPADAITKALAEVSDYFGNVKNL